MKCFNDQCKLEKNKVTIKFEKNNKTFALNVLFIHDNTKQIRSVYIAKYNSNREYQVILIIITDNKKWQYIPV